MICEIIPEKRTSPDCHTFSYVVPEKLQNKIKIGSIVDISFGKNEIRGVIFGLNNKSKITDFKYKLKNIKSINSDFWVPKNYIKIAEWISNYYFCSLGEAISLFLPPKILHPRKLIIDDKQKTTKKNIKLTQEQEKIFAALKNNLIKQEKRPALIFGVTGSGKTEIYLKLAAEALKLKKQVVVLVPEIMLTPQTLEKFAEIFPDQICLIHSGLSQSERFESYRQFYNDEKSIIIGPRSALLIPNENIGLIIVDEEQEDAYKQEKDPRYHAVKLAEKIAEKTGALLVLGTATPRIETYYKAKNKKYDLFILFSRYQKLLLPPAKIIDLKNEIKNDNFSSISLELQKKIAEVLKSKRQIILFLNRRGVSTFISCRECGEIILCPNCDIPLVYHINFNNHILNCHHCDFKTSVPTICPKCKSIKIKFFGAGIDKIENEIKKLFPKARIKKIDSKTLSNKSESMKLYDDFKSEKIDILIGTQILAKGLDVGTVDLVGIISADTGLHLPNFLANEKVFSLLTQVSGRSGRRDNVGATIIQTYWPDSLSIKFAAQHNYQAFYENEILERKKFDYPPFCHLVRIISENNNENFAKREIEKVAGDLKKEKINFIGPAKCFLSKINNKFRYHLIIKTQKLSDQKISKIFAKNPYLIWDTDPVDLL